MYARKWCAQSSENRTLKQFQAHYKSLPKEEKKVCRHTSFNMLFLLSALWQKHRNEYAKVCVCSRRCRSSMLIYTHSDEQVEAGMNMTHLICSTSALCVRVFLLETNHHADQPRYHLGCCDGGWDSRSKQVFPVLLLLYRLKSYSIRFAP